MDYCKKILVLKEIEEGYSPSGKKISGIARLECENSVSVFHLSVINLAFKEKGSYYLFLLDAKKNTYAFDLGKRPQSFNITFDNFIPADKGFACGIAYISSKIPVVVAYGGADELKISLSDFKGKVLTECKYMNLKEDEKPQEPEEPQKENELPIPDIDTPNPSIVKPTTSPYPEPTINPQNPSYTPIIPNIPTPDKEEEKDYDDEAVATENFYEKDEDFLIKLQKIKEMDKNVSIKDGVLNSASKKETTEGADCFTDFTNEADCNESKDYNSKNPYYLSVADDLNDIFTKFPKDEKLCQNLPDSKWVKINYSEDKFYVVGLIYEKGKEKYICYGVPSKYTSDPPKELKGYCSFIPLSVFDMKGDGYWMMFQDAVTGECVKK